MIPFTRVLLHFAGVLLATAAPAFAAQPNIIVYLADDMGMGDTSVYQDWTGNAAGKQLHTPNTERLAARGIRFTDAHSPSSRCSPTRYALLTGRYCWRTTLKHWVLFGVHCDPLIAPEITTLPEFLQCEGYRTGLVGKWHLGLTYTRSDGSPADGWEDADLTRPIANGPLEHGFDFFHGISRSHGTSGPNGSKWKNTPEQARGPGWMHGRSITGATGEGKKLDGSYVLDEIGPVLQREAQTLLQSAGKDPFFLYFASPANHAPYTPCRQLAGRPVRGASKFKNGQPTDSARLDFIYENDVQLGLLLDYLEKTDDPRRPGQALIENTLVIFASDNGAEIKSKTATGPLRSHKGSTYEGGHRIPFIASWPAGGIPAGSTSDRLLGLNDLYGTIADILQKPLPPRGAEDSFSQLAALRNEKTPARAPLFPNDHQEATKKRSDERAWVAVRSNATPLPGRWKLFLDHRFAFHGELHPQELYNLAADPREETNLLHKPQAKPALDFLMRAAERAKGDGGRTRTLE